MKKLFPFIAVGFIALAVLISVIPDYQKSQQPLNKLLSYGKAKGFAIGILTNDIKAAEAEIAKLEQKLNRAVPVKFFSPEEQRQVSQEASLGVPSFLIADGDGNLAVSENGEATADKLAGYFSNLHTH